MKEASNLNFNDEDDSTILKLMLLEKNLELMPDEYKTMEYLETVRTQCKAGAHFCKLEIKKRKKLQKYRRKLNSSLLPFPEKSSPTKNESRPTIVNINAPVDQVTVAGNIEAENYNQKS